MCVHGQVFVGVNAREMAEDVVVRAAAVRGPARLGGIKRVAAHPSTCTQIGGKGESSHRISMSNARARHAEGEEGRRGKGRRRRGEKGREGEKEGSDTQTQIHRHTDTRSKGCGTPSTLPRASRHGDWQRAQTSLI